MRELFEVNLMELREEQEKVALLQRLSSNNASSHLITLSARASTSAGIFTPICLAVFKLMGSSNFES